MEKIALAVRGVPIVFLSVLEQQAYDIAQSSLYQEEWGRVATLARIVPSMPHLLRVVMDRPVASHPRWHVMPLAQFYEEVAVMAAVELEAAQPRYLPLPAELVELEQHPLFLAQRPFGRLCYRELFFFEDEETGNEVYMPDKLDAGQVVAYVDGVICPRDKRAAVALPLAARVGQVVGFLSGLAVVQPHEAVGGMAILAALVAPLLVVSQPGTSVKQEPGRSARHKRLSSVR